MRRLSASEFRQDTAEYLNQVCYQGERILLHRRNKDVAVIIPLEDAALLQELEDQFDRNEIQQARKEIQKRGTIPYEEVREELGLR